MNRLEASVGQPLFVRGAGPVRLTDEGALLRDYAERLLNLREEARKGLSDLRGLARGELSLGVNESSIHALQVGETLARLFPEVQRSEEHTSELQSPLNLVCRLLPLKKNRL